jgi:hypothetical protein
MSSNSSKIRIKEDGTYSLVAMILGKPICFNRCEDCAKHSDATCRMCVKIKGNGKI